MNYELYLPQSFQRGAQGALNGAVAILIFASFAVKKKEI